MGALIGFLGACGESSEEATSGLENVVFVNEISDEALARLLEKTPVDVAAERLEIVSPSAGAELPRASATTFSWRAAGSAAKPHAPEPGSKLPRLLRALEAFLSPIGVAHAHGPPYNGVAYYLLFSTPQNPRLLRVFTAARNYTPDPASWSKLTAESGPITLSITSGVFENSLLLSDGGPFIGAATQFTIR